MRRTARHRAPAALACAALAAGCAATLPPIRPAIDAAPAVAAPAPAPVLSTALPEPAAEPEATSQSPADSSAPTVLSVFDGTELIRLAPVWTAPIIGMIRAGQSVRLAHPEAVVGPGVAACKGGWYSIVPRGFVCAGAHSRVKPADGRTSAALEALPDQTSEAPFHFGVSLGAPRYLRIPTIEEQRRIEKGTAAALVPASPADPAAAMEPRALGVPALGALARHFARTEGPLTADGDAFEGMKVAWTRELEASGRTWLVTPELELIPKDRVREERIPDLRGVDLRRDGPRLPLAYLWLGPAPKLQRGARGELMETGESWPRHGFVPVTSTVIKQRGRHYVLAQDGTYLARDQVTTIQPGGRRPPGVGPKDKWVSVRVTHGYLVAYEGDSPVYATAVSPGAEGVNPRGRRVSRTGLFAVQNKAFSWDMAGVERGTRWLVKEVPWVAFYKEDFALHGAWWHDDFGRPKSHGCINLPPADARFLFSWLDPALPEGWYSVAAYGTKVRGTVVEVRP